MAASGAEAAIAGESAAGGLAAGAPTLGVSEGTRGVHNVTHDAEHDILVSGNWHAGVWRYIQP